MKITNRLYDCPFDIVSQKPGRCVYSDCCGIVEAIAVNKSNTAFAYAGMITIMMMILLIVMMIITGQIGKCVCVIMDRSK